MIRARIEHPGYYYNVTTTKQKKTKSKKNLVCQRTQSDPVQELCRDGKFMVRNRKKQKHGRQIFIKTVTTNGKKFTFKTW